MVSGTAQCKVTNGTNIEYEEVDTSIEELGSLIKSNADSSCRQYQLMDHIYQA